MIYNIQASVANFEYALNYISVILVVIIPVLTMRSFAEERKQKTDQLLYSLPLTTWRSWAESICLFLRCSSCRWQLSLSTR